MFFKSGKSKDSDEKRKLMIDQYLKINPDKNL